MERAQTESAGAPIVRDPSVSTLELCVFFALTILGSAAWVLLSGPVVAPGAGGEAALAWFRGEALVIIWAPMLGALLMAAGFRGKAGLASLLSRFTVRDVASRWWPTALLLPVAIHAAPIFISGGLAVEAPTLLWSWISNLAFLALVMVGEELGWRGYALPALQSRRSPLVASLWLGLLWGIWHVPAWYGLVMGSTGQVEAAVAFMLASTVNTIALAVILTWLFNGSRGSVLVAMLFHGTNNACIRLYGETDSTAHHVLAYGLAAAVAVILVLRNREVFLASER